MSTTKTPLQLVDSIQKHTSELFEIRQISKALLGLTSTDPETLRITTKAFANSLVILEEDLPFVTPSEEVEA